MLPLLTVVKKRWPTRADATANACEPANTVHLCMRLNQPLLDKLESFLRDQAYVVRYEKGNFRGGYCLLEDKKTVVVNKFYPLESRVSTLIEVVLSLDATALALEAHHTQLLTQLRAHTATLAASQEATGAAPTV